MRLPSWKCGLEEAAILKSFLAELHGFPYGVAPVGQETVIGR